MLEYERFVPDSAPDFETALIDTVDHVRGHLSACVDPYDDDCASDDEVTISYHRLTDDATPGTEFPSGTMVVGVIDADPTDEYPLDAVPVEPADGEEVFE